MAHLVSPGSSRYDGGGSHHSRSFFVTELVGRYGFKGIAAICAAALLAFAPLAVLIWFNVLRLQSVVIVQPGQRVVVKTGRFQRDQDLDEPGKTALLLVRCEVPTFDGWSELLDDRDPARPTDFVSSSRFVRRELVYLRRAGLSDMPFGLLGKPPISAWLPEGNYEILVVHEPPSTDNGIVPPTRSFPWVSVFAECTLEAHHKTECRVQLPHYDWGGAAPIQLTSYDASSTTSAPPTVDWTVIQAACEQALAIPTPAGYLLSLDEPVVHHADGHRECTADPSELQPVPREWTRDQLARLRNWLPADAEPGRTRLSEMVDRLLWREFFEGWYCYAAAGIAGLVFTRWGSIALLEPWRRRQAWGEAMGHLTAIFLLAGGGWFLLAILADWHGGGPIPFRLR